MSSPISSPISVRSTLAVAGIAIAIALPGYRWGGPWTGVAPPVVRTVSQEGPRYDGEYGLFVRHVDGGLAVRWLTSGATPGLLRVYLEGEVVQESQTPDGVAHRAEVALPGDTDDDASVLLEYGPAGDPERMHRTWIQLGPAEPDSDPVYEGVDSLYVFGDSHGEFDTVTAVLRNAGLIDEQLRWTGGRQRLVFLGDLLDRGRDVTRLLWFVYGLEREAASAGGRVHTLLGNHEIMVMTGDLRYVHPKEDYIALLYGVDYSELFHPRTSVLGRWLASKPALIRIDDVLLAHGGVGPPYARYGIDEYQDSLRTFIEEDLFLRWDDDEFLAALVQETSIDSAGFMRRWDFFHEPQSVFWYRDLVGTDTLDAYLRSVLKHFRSSVHVVGHTPKGRIEQFYGGRLIAVDMEEAATELLLLAREDDDWKRLRISAEGPPRRLRREPTYFVPDQ